jgi:hypothetical protein
VAAGPGAAHRDGDRGRSLGRSSRRQYCDPAGDPFAALVGHAQALDQLRSQLGSGRLAHAYLFVGEAGLGKSTAARALAAALLPEAQLYRHPDYWEDDRIKPLSINEIRLLPDKPPEFHELSLQAFLNLKPAVGTRRVAVVANVGRLRDQDQSVLLKTLEEPHPHRVIILTTPSLNPFVVLPTVVSRCRRVFFHPVPVPEIERLLRAMDVAPERARLLADLARGRPGWAVRVAGDDAVIEEHRSWTRRLEEVFGAPADVPLNVAELDGSQWRGAGRATRRTRRFCDRELADRAATPHAGQPRARAGSLGPPHRLSYDTWLPGAERQPTFSSRNLSPRMPESAS